MKEIESKLLRLVGQRGYMPLNVPELLRALHLPPQAQQELQRVLRQLERTGRVARIKDYARLRRGGIGPQMSSSYLAFGE